jgi:glycosyltransferase involved in cell wall biosynthesis
MDAHAPALRAQDFPRLLLVNTQAFNLRSGPGITLTNLFKGWPRDRIAMVHGDWIPTTEEVCAQYYQLGDDEDLLIRVRSMLRRGFGNRPDNGVGPPGADPGDTLALRALRRVVRAVSDDRLSLRDLITPVRTTSGLARWVARFQPDLIYTQMGSIRFMQLVDDLLRMTGARLAVHFMDDWPSTLHDHPFVPSRFRRKATAMIDDLLSRASLRAGICQKMARVYEARYGYPFISCHNPFDAAEYPPRADDVADVHRPIRLVYAGGLNALTPLDAVRDVCDAIGALRAGGLDVELHIYSDSKTLDPSLVRPGVVHGGYVTNQDQVAAIYQRADVLLLPLTFRPKSRPFIALSMPTKTASYMASGTPILVYAPRDTALVEYAAEKRWAHVVSERNPTALREGILRLSHDRDLRRAVSRQALHVARTDHSAEHVRSVFHRALIEATQDLPDLLGSREARVG